MPRFRALLASTLCLFVLMPAQAQVRAKAKVDDKADTKVVIDKDKLIGEWMMILPAEAKGIDIQVSFEFTKDNKVKMKVTGLGKKDADEGTWKIDGDKLVLSRNKNGKDETDSITVKSFSAEKMILSDKGMDIEFRKKAPPAKPLAAAPEYLAFAPESKDDPKVEDIDLKKLLGKWTVPGEKATVEFLKDGKLSLSVETLKFDGTYKIEKNKLILKLNFGGEEKAETLTVKLLTDEKMQTVDSKGKEEELKRAK